MMKLFIASDIHGSARFCREMLAAFQREGCKKMLLRTLRSDAEGLYRWHWVLIDSLEIFCDAVHPGKSEW